MELELVRFPDERLRKRSEEIQAFGPEIAQLGNAMEKMMRRHGGIGFAAIQGGVPLRMLVMECPGAPMPGPIVLCNPEIQEEIGKREEREGCLSIPGVHESILRSEKVRCAWRDPGGNPREGWFEGLAAVCLQHEIDHLDGKLMFDRLSRLKADRAKARYAKQKEMARRAEKGK